MKIAQCYKDVIGIIPRFPELTIISFARMKPRPQSGQKTDTFLDRRCVFGTFQTLCDASDGKLLELCVPLGDEDEEYFSFKLLDFR